LTGCKVKGDPQGFFDFRPAWQGKADDQNFVFLRAVCMVVSSVIRMRLMFWILITRNLQTGSTEKGEVQILPDPPCFWTNAFWIRSGLKADGTVPVFA